MCGQCRPCTQVLWPLSLSGQVLSGGVVGGAWRVCVRCGSLWPSEWQDVSPPCGCRAGLCGGAAGRCDPQRPDHAGRRACLRGLASRALHTPSVQHRLSSRSVFGVGLSRPLLRSVETALHVLAPVLGRARAAPLFCPGPQRAPPPPPPSPPADFVLLLSRRLTLLVSLRGRACLCRHRSTWSRCARCGDGSASSCEAEAQTCFDEVTILG